MPIKSLPAWMENLEEEDAEFIKRFLLLSGSLKKIAAEYHVTYPTVRLRLDKLIQKIKIGEDYQEDAYVNFIKRLAGAEKISVEAARLLIYEYKTIQKEEK